MLSWAIGVGGVLAVVCMLGFPLWALGVPGISDAKSLYVRGWKMGLLAIVLFPACYFGFLLVHFIQKSRLEALDRLEWEHASAVVFICQILALVVRLTHAFYLVARSERSA